MGNTLNTELPKLSQKIYKEWLEKTRLVKSCSNEYEGEFDLENLEIDIPVFGHISIHKTSIKERDVKPAAIEFKKGSTIRVIVDKGRYNHWGETTLSKLMDRLTAEDSEHRAKLTQRWAIDADEELAIAIAKLPASRHINMGHADLLNAEITKANVVKMLDILKAHAKAAHMDYQEFELFASEKLGGILRDAQIDMGSTPAKQAFGEGYIGKANGVEIFEHEVGAIVKRDTNTKLVVAEHAIWKTRDGVQYVVPFKTTTSYELSKDQVLLGGIGYQTVEYYDFFNIYPERLWVVDLKYTATAVPPVYTGTVTSVPRDAQNLKAGFGTVKNA